MRLRLINLLAGGREICVCHLHEALELPQPTTLPFLYGALPEVRPGGHTQRGCLGPIYQLAEPASALHRSLLVCIELADVTTFEQDRQRLDRVISCCEGS